MDREGRTALIAAAHTGCVKTVEVLLDHEASVNHADSDGRTALAVCILSEFLKNHLAFLTMPFEKSGDGSSGVQLLKQRLSSSETEQGRRHGLSFKPRPDDVFVVTPPKCGTTWMQQILHQLRSGGDMSFDEISDVVPYIEMAYDIEINLDAEHHYQPR
ncbi:sulfotransferase domain-containing [Paramuricea clavata]|uniref:Sulfotransferase domain-containing n=1 Tax=Paramuricea clavata TaxID=317549 RepID=A0A7D9JQE2_PARCT|nr:sulfotransferase domain-containing [Paramuricea clavata]